MAQVALGSMLVGDSHTRQGFASLLVGSACSGWQGFTKLVDAGRGRAWMQQHPVCTCCSLLRSRAVQPPACMHAYTDTPLHRVAHKRAHTAPTRPFSDNMGLAVYAALVHAYLVCLCLCLCPCASECPCVCSGRLGWHVAATFGCAADEEQNMPPQAADARATAPPPKKSYLDVGMTNSAPLPIVSGQRCMIDFCLV